MIMFFVMRPKMAIYMKNNGEINTVRGINIVTGNWHCLICGHNMGRFEGKKFCRTTECSYMYISEDEESDTDEVISIYDDEIIDEESDHDSTVSCNDISIVINNS